MEIGFYQGGLSSCHERRLREHFEANLSKKIFMRDLQKITKLSRCYFSRAFKTTFGEAPVYYLLHRRIEESQHLMASTKESVIQIALACGFDNQSHFSRKFRWATGCPPTQWRRARQEINGRTSQVAARVIDAAKKHGGRHAGSREIVAALTL